MAIDKTQCFTCEKEKKSTYSSRGCYKDFCFSHLIKHHQIFYKEFQEIEYDCDRFRQRIIQ